MQVINPQENPVLPTPGHTGAVSQEIAGAVAGAKSCVVKLGTFEPGGTSEFHLHPRSEQVFYVLQGALTMLGEDRREFTAPAGAAIHIPAGELHAAFNYGTDKTVYVVVTAPPE